jgi:hypothetical protein
MSGLRRVCAILVLPVVLAGCSGTGRDPTPTYSTAPRPVRAGETAVHTAPRADGRITFTVIGLRTGITYVVGSHGDQKAQGRFVRVRLVAANGYPNFHTLGLGRERLLTTDGKAYAISENATRIKRQPDSLDIGAGDRIEFDLWFDIPAAARVAALRLYGEPTDDLGVSLPVGPGVRVPLG